MQQLGLALALRSLNLAGKNGDGRRENERNKKVYIGINAKILDLFLDDVG